MSSVPVQSSNPYITIAFHDDMGVRGFPVFLETLMTWESGIWGILL